MTALKFHMPRYSELPKVPLYKEQVIAYLEEIFKENGINEYEKVLTPTMINNYVKQKIVSPPKDKKYNEKHLAYLIVVCILKQVFTLQEICVMIRMQIESSPIEIAYDYFCEEVEEALEVVFITRDFARKRYVVEKTLGSEMVKSSVMACAHKLYIQINLEQEKG